MAIPIQIPELDPSIQSAPPSSSLGVMADNTTFPRIVTLDDAGNPSILLNGQYNVSVAQQTGFATDTYLTGSSCKIPIVGKWRAGTIYRCGFDMVKTGAGTAAFTVNVRMGTLGNGSDASVLSLAFAVGTAVIDTGWFDILLNFRTVGSGTSAVIRGLIKCYHHLAATGLITTGASGFGLIAGTSSGFNSTTQNFIGVSVNGGTSFSGTCDQVQSFLSL